MMQVNFCTLMNRCIQTVFLMILLSPAFYSTLAVSAVNKNTITHAQPSKKDPTKTITQPKTVWESLIREFKLDHRSESWQVKNEIRKYLANRNKLNQILKAATPYLYYIQQQTLKYNLPTEIALIPAIESEFNPYDHSNKGAVGLWQLMPGTAHDLGIRVGYYYDGRRNVTASTKAALAYFKDLGKLFKGNWYLAIAAYNAGQYKILSSMRYYGSHNYWNLPLPHETKLFVPKLLALATIVKNPKKYGITLPPIQNAPYFTELKLGYAKSLAEIAKSNGFAVETLKILNPDFKHRIIAKNGIYSLLVPINTTA